MSLPRSYFRWFFCFPDHLAQFNLNTLSQLGQRRHCVSIVGDTRLDVTGKEHDTI
ncbi:MAG: hypothetical protein AB8B64_01185 [Granulosicoccus sp.]